LAWHGISSVQSTKIQLGLQKSHVLIRIERLHFQHLVPSSSLARISIFGGRSAFKFAIDPRSADAQLYFRFYSRFSPTSRSQKIGRQSQTRRFAWVRYWTTSATLANFRTTILAIWSTNPPKKHRPCTFNRAVSVISMAALAIWKSMGRLCVAMEIGNCWSNWTSKCFEANSLRSGMEPISPAPSRSLISTLTKCKINDVQCLRNGPRSSIKSSCP